MAVTLVLSRHGLTERSSPEQHLGQAIDIPLTAAGRQQARSLGRRLAGAPFERIIASPLRRALETARIVAGTRPVVPDGRLAEMDYGRWEGMTYADIDRRDFDLRRAWERDPAALPCPGGESAVDVGVRARAFLDDLLEPKEGRGPADRLVLVIGHASLNRILLCVALDVPLGDYRRRFIQAQANVTVLRWTNGSKASGAELRVLNDTAHLQRRGDAPWGGSWEGPQS